jgi:hypothetical protein
MLLLGIIMIGTAVIVGNILKSIRKRINNIDKQVKEQYEQEKEKRRGS